MKATYTTGTPEKLDYGLHTLTVTYNGTNKDLIKKLKRYCDDMFETKGRELIQTYHSRNIIIFQFTGREIQFNQIGPMEP